MANCPGTWQMATFDNITPCCSNLYSYRSNQFDSPRNAPGNIRSIQGSSTGTIYYSDNAFHAGAIQFGNVRFIADDPNCLDPAFDCVNGQVVAASLYGTPGAFDTEAEAQANCGGNGCNGVCLETAEYTGLKAKLEKIKVDLS